MRIIFFYLATLLWPAMSAQAALAVVFNGAGTCDGCAEAVAQVLRAQHYQVQLVDEHTLSAASLQAAQLYVQPGGSDDIMDTLSVLSVQQIQSIQQFVAQGGAYLGICAGGYLAGHYADHAAGIRAFGLVELDEVAQERADTNQAQVIAIALPGETEPRQVYYQAGPHFGTTVPAKGRVLAYYAASKHVAARVSSYGHGRVGLIGPHYEADQSWFVADGLAPAPPQQSLLTQMLDALVAPSTVAF